MSVLTTYPPYFIWVCVLLGLTGALLLYYKENKGNRFDKQWIITLGSIRFVGITILSFLLLRPILENINQKIEKPIVVVLQDNSASIQEDLKNKDAFITPLQNRLNQMGEDVEVIYYQFDEELKSGWDSLNGEGVATDASKAIDLLSTRMSGRNLSAVVFPTDGIFNKGSYPLYAAKNLNVPFFPIGLGDTTLYKDVLISDLQCNKICFLGNSFPVQVNIESILSKGNASQISITHKGQKIAKRDIFFLEDRSFSQEIFNLTADAVGMQRYQVHVQEIAGEKIISNNHFEFYIQVIDDRQKINIVAHSPHPDVQALLQSIDHSENYVADFQLAENYKSNDDKIGLTILHGMPANVQEQNIIKQLLAKGQPCLFIWSQQTDLALFNQLNTGINIQSSGTIYEDIKGASNPTFSYFQTSSDIGQHISLFPPLKVPFGKINLSPDMGVQFQQRIGNLSSNAPLIAFHQNQIAKMGWIGGEGIWRWRMAEFIKSKNHDLFDQMVSQWVQYLSTNSEEDKLKVETQKKWNAHQNVVITGHLLDESYHPLPNQNITLQLINEENGNLDYTFLPNGEHYKLALGKLPAGSYRFVAKAFNGSQNLMDQGSFIVETVQLEQTNSVAHHSALRNIAYETGGQFFTKNELDSLPSALKKLPHLVSASYSEQSREEWIELPWVMFLLISCFGGEWLLRKRLGGY